VSIAINFLIDYTKNIENKYENEFMESTTNAFDSINTLLNSWETIATKQIPGKEVLLSERILLKQEKNGQFSFADKAVVRKNLSVRIGLIREKGMYKFSKNIVEFNKNFMQLMGQLKPEELQDKKLISRIKNFIVYYNNFLEKAASKKAHAEIPFGGIKKFFNKTGYSKTLNKKIKGFLDNGKIDFTKLEAYVDSASERVKIKEYKEKIEKTESRGESDLQFKNKLIKHIDDKLEKAKNELIPCQLSGIKKEHEELIIDECKSKKYDEIWKMLSGNVGVMGMVINDIDPAMFITGTGEKILLEKVKDCWDPLERKLESFLRNVEGLRERTKKNLSYDSIYNTTYSKGIDKCMRVITKKDLEIIVGALEKSHDTSLQEYFFKTVYDNWKLFASHAQSGDENKRKEFLNIIAQYKSIDDLLTHPSYVEYVLGNSEDS